MDHLKAKQLINHFNLLPRAEQLETLKLLAQQTSVEELLFMLNELSAGEQERFAQEVVARLGTLATQMNQRDNRDRLQEAFERGAGADIPPQLIMEHLESIAEDKVSARRNRQPSPETITKNVAICDAKARGSPWRNGRKYGITKQRISAVLKDEPRWRRLAKKGQPTR